MFTSIRPAGLDLLWALRWLRRLGRGREVTRMPAIGGGAGSIVLGLACLLPGCSSPSDSERTEPANRLATYVWSFEEWETPEASRALLGGLSDAGVSDVFLDITGVGAGHPGSEVWHTYTVSIRSALDLADELGLRLHALAGGPEWARNLEPATAIAGFVKERAETGDRLESLQFDVEPWGLPGADLEIAAQDLVTFARSITALDPSVPVGFAIPYWFDGTTEAVATITVDGGNATPIGHLASILRSDTGDYVVVMAYADRVEGEGGVLHRATKTLAEMPASTVWVAVDFSPHGELATNFFDVPGRTAMHIPAEVLTEAGVNDSFVGVAVHDSTALLRQYDRSLSERD